MADSISTIKSRLKYYEGHTERLERKVLDLEAKLKVYTDLGDDLYVSPQQLAALYAELASITKCYLDAERNNTMYRQWFTRNANWTQLFNNMMKYDPTLGNYNRKGADEPIIPPPVEHWEVVKGIPKLSTVVEPEEEV